MADEAVTTHAGTGLYLHVPFCARLCAYCDFNRVADTDPATHRRYVAALTADLVRVAAGGPTGVAPAGVGVDDAWPAFTSVFVGGGTPTLLPARDLVGVLRLARRVLPVADDAEVTVEANPETVDADYFDALVEGGVNRVSLGAQSFSTHVLRSLGRWHDPERPLKAVFDALAAGVPRVSLDLIYGAPAETDLDWARSLHTALGTGVGHVSAYALTLEPNTEYAARVRTGVAAAPDDDLQAGRMAAADTRLTAAGLRRYEVSNWARPGQQCRHNLTYWRGGNWLGVGAGAHGHWQASAGPGDSALGRRWWSLRGPARYADAALAGEPTTAGEEVVETGARRTERLLLGLRLAEGVPRTQVAPVDESEVRRLAAAGLLDDDGDRLRLTRDGWAVAGAVTLRLVG